MTTITNHEITVQEVKDAVGFSISHRDIISQINYLESVEEMYAIDVEISKKQIRKAVKDNDYQAVVEIAEILKRRMTRQTAISEMLSERYAEGTAKLEQEMRDAEILSAWSRNKTEGQN